MRETWRKDSCPIVSTTAGTKIKGTLCHDTVSPRPKPSDKDRMKGVCRVPL